MKGRKDYLGDEKKKRGIKREERIMEIKDERVRGKQRTYDANRGNKYLNIIRYKNR